MALLVPCVLPDNTFCGQLVIYEDDKIPDTKAHILFGSLPVAFAPPSSMFEEPSCPPEGFPAGGQLHQGPLNAKTQVRDSDHWEALQ